ncbi:MAG: metal ABC transporter substrate-binding protein [Clostridiales bacterium]|jgi:D-methionine transport system substrate-binding protein|nr:metal ABC transporter substrate-binding protein [Clostridiales bacterium]
MKKNILVTTLVIILSAILLVGCGSSSDDEANKVIKVGATPSPHAEILEAVRGEVEAAGYELEIVEFQDYILPNTSLDTGELDANFFQHQPYLTDFNDNNGTDLVSVGVVHYEPLGIYKGSKSSIADLKAGDKIAVPNDTTNEARALQLLQAEGIIKLKDGVGLEATKIDIIENPYDVEIVELEAAVIPRSLPDLALAVINGNYALSAELTSDDAIAYEAADSEAAEEFANVIAVKSENKDSEKSKVLYQAITSDTVKSFIKDKYKGSVLIAF